MKRRYLRLFFMVATLSALTLLVSCPTPDESLFFDDFESYALSSSWTPAGGWFDATGFESAEWEIVADGGQGHVVHQTNAVASFLVQNSFTGDDYAFTLKVKTSSATGQVGIVGRYQDEQNYYYLVLGQPDGQGVMLRKLHGGTDEGCGSAAYPYTTGTWYELTLVFDGNVVTGLVDGVEVITYTDDGVKEGPLIPNGKIGFGSDIVDLGSYDDALVVQNP